MHVQPQPPQEVVDEVNPSHELLLQQQQEEEGWSIEGLIFPQLLKEGVGQRCYYCWTKTGYSVNFTSLGQYAKHVLYQHEGYSIYVFDEDVNKYKEELAALRKKQIANPKQFRQPAAGINLVNPNYYMRYGFLYKKNSYRKIKNS